MAPRIQLRDYFRQNQPMNIGESLERGITLGSILNRDRREKDKYSRDVETDLRRINALKQIAGQKPQGMDLGYSLIGAGEVGAGIGAIQQDRLERSKKLDRPEIDLELGRIFSTIKDPESWARAKAEYETAGVIVPAWDSPTREQWVIAKMKPAKEKESIYKNQDDLYKVGSAKQAEGTYAQWYNTLGEEQKNVLPSPESANLAKALETGAGVVSRGETFQDRVAQAGTQTEQGKVNLQGSQLDLSGKTLSANEAQEEMNRRGDMQDGLRKVVPEKDQQAVREIKNDLDVNLQPIKESKAEMSKLENTLKMKTPDGSLVGVSALASVYQFMKFLDPRSVVKESEFDAFERLRGIIGTFENLDDKAKATYVVNKRTVDEIERMVDIVKKSMIEKSKEVTKPYADRVYNLKIHPQNIVDDKDILDGVMSSYVVRDPAQTKSALQKARGGK